MSALALETPSEGDFLTDSDNELKPRSGRLEAKGTGKTKNAPERETRSEDDLEFRLAAAVRNKDRKATAEFVEAFADALYAYVAHRLFPNATQAEDLVQEVFLAALKNIATYTGKASLKGWLLGIARHKVDDYYRLVLREARLDDIEAVELESDPDFDELVHRDHLRTKTLETLGRMRESYRLLLRWRYWDLKSTSEMAALTGSTEKAIKRALARARVQFKEMWEKADA